MQFSPYELVPGCDRVYINNSKLVDGKRRLWRYVFDYEKNSPREEKVPIKLKSVDGLRIFRYIKASLFWNDLNNPRLAFLSPSIWNDPFESFFYRENGLTINGKTYHIRCVCFTYDWIDSEEAAWKRSSSEGESVRVEYDFDELCQSLEQQKEFGNIDFYFSVIDYSLSRKDITKLKRKQPANLGEYLNLLSLKRKAFSYENEIRLFMVNKVPFAQEIVKVSYDINAVKSICFPPKAPSILARIEEYAREKGIETKQSRLYEID